MGNGSQDQFFVKILPNEYSRLAELDKAVALYKDFRLKALKLAPESYGSTYEQEMLFDNHKWIQRLTNPNAKTFIALEHASDHQQSLHAERFKLWVGTVTARRTGQPEDFEAKGVRAVTTAVESGKTSEYDGVQALDTPLYHINALFVMPEQVGRGLGRRLVKEALSWIEDDCQSRGFVSGRVELITDSWNKTAIGVYSKCGFETGKEFEVDVAGSTRRALKMSYVFKVDIKK